MQQPNSPIPEPAPTLQKEIHQSHRHHQKPLPLVARLPQSRVRQIQRKQISRNDRCRVAPPSDSICIGGIARRGHVTGGSIRFEDIRVFQQCFTGPINHPNPMNVPKAGCPVEDRHSHGQITGTKTRASLPRIAPLFRIPAAFVNFDEVEVGDCGAVVL